MFSLSVPAQCDECKLNDGQRESKKIGLGLGDFLLAKFKH